MVELGTEIVHTYVHVLESSIYSKPFAYLCVCCGCTWRDNYNGSMSLFGKNSKSCEICEQLGLNKLKPLFENRTVAIKSDVIEIRQYSDKDMQQAFEYKFEDMNMLELSQNEIK